MHTALKLLIGTFLALIVLVVALAVFRPEQTAAQRFVVDRAECQREAGLFPLPDYVKEGTATGFRLLGQYYQCMYARGYTNVPPLH